MDPDPQTRARRKRPLLRRAGWRAVSHLVRHNPGAALSAAGAGVKFMAGELVKGGTRRARRLGEKLRRKPAEPDHAPSLADAYEESELRALAELGRKREPPDEDDGPRPDERPNEG